MPDARVQAAIDHWAPRFVQAGVDYSDFVATTAGVEHWEDWHDAWCRNADMHAGLVRFHDFLTRSNVKHVFYESPGTSHEWQTWRRDLKDFAPRLFQGSAQ